MIIAGLIQAGVSIDLAKISLKKTRTCTLEIAVRLLHTSAAILARLFTTAIQIQNQHDEISTVKLASILIVCKLTLITQIPGKIGLAKTAKSGFVEGHTGAAVMTWITGTDAELFTIVANKSN